MITRWLVLVASFLIFSVAQAGRMLPASAQPGELQAAEYPYVKIGGNILRLAPGARIFDKSNRIILPAAMPGEAKIFFQLDSRGEVLNLWLATPEEAASQRN